MPSSAAEIARRIVAWYGEHGRSMPWRETREPYHIWLSEVMLQQTQVATVRGYYARFLAAYPTIADLAAAPLDDVLRIWEGLGYYARCRNLHAAARAIVEQHDGVFPRAFDDVLALPGVGRSTAGAIATFALDDARPILDANVRRVLCRLYAIDTDPYKAAARDQLWQRSGALVDATDDAYSLNQGLMELGATLCRGREPDCGACPVATACLAREQGRQSELPVKRERKPRPHKVVGLGLVARADGRLLIQRRPEEGLLGGLWEFPGGKQEEGEPLTETVRRELAEELGIEVDVGERLIVVDHAYSHFTVALHAYHCTLTAGEPTPRAATELRWVQLDELADFAFPRANRKIVEALTEPLPPLLQAAETIPD